MPVAWRAPPRFTPEGRIRPRGAGAEREAAAAAASLVRHVEGGCAGPDGVAAEPCLARAEGATG
ncbi:hypothetical protein [Streptomyces sp. NPDC047706]|uniref:hypothetical protein n=1 Tax=Streptomyces sp. NPDC047706 TaxID=3365486 RepID=UPI0037145F22